MTPSARVTGICVFCSHHFTTEHPKRHCPDCRVKAIAAGVGDPEQIGEMSGT